MLLRTLKHRLSSESSWTAPAELPAEVAVCTLDFVRFYRMGLCCVLREAIETLEEMLEGAVVDEDDAS